MLVPLQVVKTSSTNELGALEGGGTLCVCVCACVACAEAVMQTPSQRSMPLEEKKGGKQSFWGGRRAGDRVDRKGDSSASTYLRCMQRRMSVPPPASCHRLRTANPAWYSKLQVGHISVFQYFNTSSRPGCSCCGRSEMRRAMWR
jgi:hypothetical protein